MIGSGFTRKHNIRVEGHTKDKHSSLFRLYLSYEDKGFLNTAPDSHHFISLIFAQFHKTFFTVVIYGLA
jgi:hypothetical protein